MKLFFLFLAFLGLPSSGYAEHRKRPVTAPEVKAVIQAVEDEIYDYGQHGEFYQIGDNLGTPQHWKSRMRIYINPEYDLEDGVGQVIYKFMPYGEILRFFFLEGDGKVELDGDPHNRFPPTQPSLQTVYMDDQKVCRMKQSWLKRFFVIDVSPTPEIIQQAARRQKLRTGYSDWEGRQPESK
jgi:hypothetical protein